MKKILKISAIIGIAVIVTFALYHLIYKKMIQPQVKQIKGIKFVTAPQDLDSVILKNGLVFDGRIIAETKGTLVLDMYFDCLDLCFVF